MPFRWFTVLASQLAVVVSFWAWDQIHHPLGNQLTGSSAGQLLAYGRLAGLLVVFFALFQLILIGRTRWVERVCPLDRLTRFHHVAGFSILALLLAHPVLVTMGHAANGDTTFRAQFLDFLGTWEDVDDAAIALGIAILALFFSAVILLKRMRYEVWHLTHLSFYAVIILGFGHQLAVGTDFTTNRWFKCYWLCLYAFVGLNIVWFRFCRLLMSSARHRFTVTSVVPETADVSSVIISGRNLDAFNARAGQFLIVRFLQPGFRWEAHPFSVSAVPREDRIRLTIKAVGDFTRRIPDLKPGTRVIIDGPHGAFTAGHATQAGILLIAGGIGITPIRALGEELILRGRDVILLYFNRTRGGIVFERELAELAAASAKFKVIHILSDDPTWSGEKGRIDRDRVARLVPDVAEREVFLCGPPPMMKAALALLRQLGVRSRPHHERFAL